MGKVKVKAVIEKGGANDNIIIMEGLTILNSPIFVTKGFNSNEVVGVANVFKEDGVLMAEFEIEEKFLNFYPAVGVQVLKWNIDKKGVRVINECKLFSLGISMAPNADPSIPRLCDNTNFCDDISSQLN